MGVTGGVLSNLKQPEYTGENRCMPCTVVNSLIAVALSLGIGAVVAASVSTAAGGAVGGGVLVVSVGAIYVRGYLVPGTPELTKRYFPAWLLRLFGKAPTTTAEYDGDVEPEQALMAVGALEECKSGEDLCLTDEFEREWEAAIEQVSGDEADRTRLLSLLDVEEGDLEFVEYGDAFEARLEHRVVGKWESEAAFLADLGAGSVLAERYTNWGELSVEDRSQLLNGLRLFIHTCPSCGGVPEFGTDTVESCCSTHEVAAVSCTECDTRLFESQPL
jgi:hypothetical protein